MGPAPRLEGVQIFRGMAALAVLLHHINLQFSAFVPGTPDLNANPWPWTVHRLGFLGVDFFFVLSGFIIYHIHRRDLGVAQQGRTFFLKRFFRIQPLLFFIVLLKQAYLTVVDKNPEELGVMVNTMFALPGENMVGVVWTLTFEWMFYLFFLVCILGGSRWLRVLGAVWVLAVIGCSGVDKWDWNPWLRVPLRPYVVQFFCGLLAAEAFHRWPDRVRASTVWIAPLLVVLLLVGLLAAPFNLTSRQMDGVLDMALARYFWGIFFGVLVWWTAVNDVRFRSRLQAPLLLLGNASYSIYLFHNEALQAFIQVGHTLEIFQHLNAVFWMWVYTGMILGVGVVIHLLFERPVLGWSRRFIRARQRGRAEAS
jgi:peptidoglycan/LPS O-acetylase OafA/YrhL